MGRAGRRLHRVFLGIMISLAICTKAQAHEDVCAHQMTERTNEALKFWEENVGLLFLRMTGVRMGGGNSLSADLQIGNPFAPLAPDLPIELIERIHQFCSDTKVKCQIVRRVTFLAVKSHPSSDWWWADIFRISSHLQEREETRFFVWSEDLKSWQLDLTRPRSRGLFGSPSRSSLHPEPTTIEDLGPIVRQNFTLEASW